MKDMIPIKKDCGQNGPDKFLKSFLVLSLFLLILAGIIFTVSTVSYLNPYPNLHGIIILILMAAAVLSILFIITVAAELIYVYNTQDTNAVHLYLARVGFYLLMPALMFVSEYFKGYKSSFLIFYIKLNNIIARSVKTKYSPEDILILLPHCLQDSSCPYKVTNFISNCRKCSKCDIGSIKEITESYNITSVEVVTGGTSARSIAARIKPKFLIAVACERDLSSGIADVRNIPVIGILNRRPNGPCVDTKIEAEELRETLDSILK